MTSAILESWRLEPRLAIALLLTSIVYLRGWRMLRHQMPARFGAWQAAAFHAGLAMVFVAMASPLDAFAGLLLQAHMAQHLLLMTAAPALLLLGAPALPLLRGLPAVAVGALGPFLAAPEIRRLGSWLLQPALCFLAMSAATWLWHLPGPYQLALRSPDWHQLEHASFLVAGLLFWWPVVQPWPSTARWPGWTLPLYLLLADVQNTVLSAILVFSGRVLYPAYESVPRLGGITALDDQVSAGVLMWVPMSLAYLVPAAVITVRLLSPARPARQPAPAFEGLLLAARRRQGVDLLRVPLLGSFLRSPATRAGLQLAMLLLAAAVVADGLLGPQMSPMNLAGVLPWTYGRGFAVVALLALGNLFCMACPFTLPRTLARRLGWQGRWAWPRRLRSKWPAVALLLLFFWAYEVLALWDSPRWTAALVAGYVAAAFAVDVVFRGASFCKYVCPIGQFQFLHSLVSPFDVRPREAAVCASCTTHDCLRGNESNTGCGTGLLVPRKVGGLDCTLCLDCVRACPHDNVGLIAVAPGHELWRGPELSSLGRLSGRLDIGILALLLVSASLVTAALMVAPVVAWEKALAGRLGLASTASVTSLLLLVGVAVVPALLLALGGAAGRRLSGVVAPAREIFCRLAMALLPLGAAVWAAHVLFHLLGGWYSALPVMLRVVGAEPVDWTPPPAPIGAGALLELEVLLLDAGLLLALYSGWRVAGSYTRTSRAAFAMLLPWMLLAVALYAGGVWVFLQPMEMRGMVH